MKLINLIIGGFGVYLIIVGMIILLGEHDGTGYTNFIISKTIGMVITYLGYSILNRFEYSNTIIEYLKQNDSDIFQGASNQAYKDFMFVLVIGSIFLVITLITIFNYGWFING